MNGSRPSTAPNLRAALAWSLTLLVAGGAIGGGAGLGAAFRSPLLGAAYALEELSAVHGLPLMAPTLILGASAVRSTPGWQRAWARRWSSGCCRWRC